MGALTIASCVEAEGRFAKARGLSARLEGQLALQTGASSTIP